MSRFPLMPRLLLAVTALAVAGSVAVGCSRPTQQPPSEAVPPGPHLSPEAGEPADGYPQTIYPTSTSFPDGYVAPEDRGEATAETLDEITDTLDITSTLEITSTETITP